MVFQKSDRRVGQDRILNSGLVEVDPELATQFHLYPNLTEVVR